MGLARGSALLRREKLTKNSGEEVKGFFGHCRISVAGICSVASTAGIERQEQGNQWTYFLRPPWFTVPPLRQGVPSCSCFLRTQGDATAVGGSSAEVCRGREWRPAPWGTNPTFLQPMLWVGIRTD